MPTLHAKEKPVIDVDEAMMVVAKTLPDEGISIREFLTRAARLRGESDHVVEQALALWIADGGQDDDIVKIGPAGMRLN